MKPSVLAVAAALALVAQPLTAQTTSPTQDRFKFVGVLPGAPIIYGNIVGVPYLGSFDTAPNVWGSPFFIWCVDYDHRIATGNTYDVWISPLDGTDFSKTLMGKNGQATQNGVSTITEYRWAAYIAGKMDWWVNSANKTRDGDAEAAIWALLGYGPTPTTVLNTFVTNWGAQFGVGANFWTGTPALNTYQDWAIITCNPAVQPCAYQEFIYMQPGGTTEVTPEPATLTLLGTGLASVLGLRRKRRVPKP